MAGPRQGEVEFDVTRIDLTDVEAMRAMFLRFVKSLETELADIGRRIRGVPLGDEAIKRGWML